MKAIQDIVGTLTAEQQAVLSHVHDVIASECTDAIPVITYGMPGFKYKSKYLISYMGFKNHMSLFPGAGAIASVEHELTGFVLSKGTVQFTVEKPLSEDVLRKIVRARMQEIDTPKK